VTGAVDGGRAAVTVVVAAGTVVVGITDVEVVEIEVVEAGPDDAVHGADPLAVLPRSDRDDARTAVRSPPQPSPPISSHTAATATAGTNRLRVPGTEPR
jgi:hypothetical protein